MNELLDGKDEGSRCEIARRVGERLAVSDMSEVDRRAAETLARALTDDAIELVRRALSEAVRHAPLLPKDIAFKIAHDVDGVAIPFLEVTEVFSENDWEQLVLTISRGALVAVSGRSSMPEFLARRLAELGDSVVAASLIENRATPMTHPVCHSIIDRFEAEMWVLDKLAYRRDLLTDIAAKLALKVSRVAAEKLRQTYDLDAVTAAVMPDVEKAALVRLVTETDAENMLVLARRLKKENKLVPDLILAALRRGALEFCAASLSLLSNGRLEQVRSVLLRADAATVIRLLTKAGVSKTMQDEFWTKIEAARNL